MRAFCYFFFTIKMRCKTTITTHMCVHWFSSAPWLAAWRQRRCLLNDIILELIYLYIVRFLQAFSTMHINCSVRYLSLSLSFLKSVNLRIWFIVMQSTALVAILWRSRHKKQTRKKRELLRFYVHYFAYRTRTSQQSGWN